MGEICTFTEDTHANDFPLEQNEVKLFRKGKVEHLLYIS